jgi:hypothetical protein
MSFHLRDVRPDDLDAVLRLNQDARPAVSDTTPDALSWFADVSVWFKVAEDEGGELGGFLIALDPGVDYGSMNYAWFTARYDSFAYVDRIVIAQHARGAGLGRRFYEELEAFARPRAPWILCEVNTRPRNEISLAFHDRLGFEAVGEQGTEGGSKSVVMLRKAVSAAP